LHAHCFLQPFDIFLGLRQLRLALPKPENPEIAAAMQKVEQAKADKRLS